MAAENKETVPAWKSLTAERLAAIDDARNETKAKGELVMDPKGTYSIMCPACQKPNTITVDFCTGCSFPCTKWDIQRQPDNIFLEMVNQTPIGKALGSPVLWRDETILVFDDKFGVSVNHLDVIPTAVYEDIRVLTREHVPLLEAMYARGKEEFMRRNIAWLKDDDIDDFISAGYNFPVSVKHLHIHMMVPPYKHHKILQHPRWHPHAKVVADLKEHGRVRLYSEQEDPEAGQAEWQRAMDNEKRVLEKIKALEGAVVPSTSA